MIDLFRTNQGVSFKTKSGIVYCEIVMRMRETIVNESEEQVAW